MKNQVQISFHGFDHTDAVERNIRERVTKLDKMFHRITACRVVVEAEHHDDVNTAVRDLFSTMERRLKDYVRRRWHDARHRPADQPLDS